MLGSNPGYLLKSFLLYMQISKILKNLFVSPMGADFLITPFKELTIFPKFILELGIYDTYEQVGSFSLGFA